MELGGLCTQGPLDFAHPAYPIATPMSIYMAESSGGEELTAFSILSLVRRRTR